MNVNLLTIDSHLTPAMDTGPSFSKSDSTNKSDRFDLSLNGEKVQPKSYEKPPASNIDEKKQNNKKPSDESPPEFTPLINKGLTSEKSEKTDDKTVSKEQNITSGSSKRESLIQSWLSEYSIGMEQNKESNPAKKEARPGLQIPQITTNKHNKPASVTGNAIKSGEIKLLHTTEKGQLGIKTILPEKSNGQNGLKSIKLEQLGITPAARKKLQTANNNEKATTSAKTISSTEKGNTKELATEVTKNTPERTTTIGIKPKIVNINSMTVQQKPSQTAGMELEKHASAVNSKIKTTTSQDNTNLLNPNSKESLHSGNNSSENPSVQKIKAAAVQFAAGQTKDQGNSDLNKNSSQGFEQIISQNNSQTLITEQPTASAKGTAANLPGQSSSDASADIGKQIIESVQKSISQQSTDHQITVRLNPPELGKVLIRFQQQDSELTGLMEVNKTQTRFEIEQALPQIIRNLADSGIHIKRLEVMLSIEQQPGQGTFGNQSLQSGGSQQQYSANPQSPGNDSALSQENEWLTGNNSYDNLSELQEALLTDGSINLLI